MKAIAVITPLPTAPASVPSSRASRPVPLKESGCRELVVRILRDAICDFRHLCRRGIVQVHRDSVSYHWPDEFKPRTTKGGTVEFKCGGLTARSEVKAVVDFLGQEHNPLLLAFGIHLRGHDLLQHLAATCHWRDDYNHAELYGERAPESANS